MNLSRSLELAVSVVVGLSSVSIEAFQQQPRSSAIISKTILHSKNCDDDGRRSFLSRSAGTTISVLLGGTVLGKPAVASYTAYARREEDWKERSEKGGESLTVYAFLSSTYHIYVHPFPTAFPILLLCLV